MNNPLLKIINKYKCLYVFIFIILFIIPCTAENIYALKGWEYQWEKIVPDDIHNPEEQISVPEKGWQPVKVLINPSGRQDNSILWLKCQLPKHKFRDPSLFIDNVYRIFEVFQNSKVIYSYGNFNKKGKEGFQPRAWHTIPLENDYENSLIFFRIYSFDNRIGILNDVLLSSRSDHIQRLVSREISRIILAFFFLITGLLFIGLQVFRKKHIILLWFGISIVLIAVWNISHSQVKQVFLHSPMFWLYAEHITLYLSPAFLALAFEQVFGKGYFSILRRMEQFFFIYTLFAVIISIFNPYYLRSITLHPHLVIISLLIFFVVIYLLYRAVNKNYIAKILAPGAVIFAATVIYDSYISIGGHSFKRTKVSHWGFFILIITIAVLVERFLSGKIPGRQKLLADEADGQIITPQAEKKIKQAVTYIQNNYSNNISREEIAQHTGLHPDYLGKIFKICTGDKINDYINNLRINKSLELLKNSDMSIIEVSFAVGYENLSTFYRIFHKITGDSPKNIRGKKESGVRSQKPE